MTNQLRYLAFGVGVLSLLIAASARAEISPSSGEMEVPEGAMIAQNVAIQNNSEAASLFSDMRLATAEKAEPEMPHLSDIKQPATSVDQWSQIERQESEPAPTVQITGVSVNATGTGLEVILETTGELRSPQTSVVDNALIAFPMRC